MKNSKDVTPTPIQVEAARREAEWETISKTYNRPPIDVAIFPNKAEFLLAQSQLHSEGKDLHGVYPIRYIGSTIIYSRFDVEWVYEDHMHLVTYYPCRAAIAKDVSTDRWMCPGNVISGDGGRWIMIGERWACYSGAYIHISKEIWEAAP